MNTTGDERKGMKMAVFYYYSVATILVLSIHDIFCVSSFSLYCIVALRLETRTIA